jgi:hypothetical protein
MAGIRADRIVRTDYRLLLASARMSPVGQSRHFRLRGVSGSPQQRTFGQCPAFMSTRPIVTPPGAALRAQSTENVRCFDDGSKHRTSYFEVTVMVFSRGCADASPADRS